MKRRDQQNQDLPQSPLDLIKPIEQALQAKAVQLQRYPSPQPSNLSTIKKTSLNTSDKNRGDIDMSNQSLDEQLSIWKNFADPNDREKAMQRNFELKMGLIASKYGGNEASIERAVAAKKAYQNQIRPQQEIKVVDYKPKVDLGNLHLSPDAVSRSQIFHDKVHEALQMHDEGFYAMLDAAVEEACSDPLKLGQDNKTWKVVDETAEKDPKNSQDSIMLADNFDQQYLEMDKYTAPENRKKFAATKIPIPKNEQNDFDTGLKMNPQLIAQNIALKKNQMPKYKELRNIQLDMKVDDLELDDYKTGGLNFGIDDADSDDLVDKEKIQFGDDQTDSLLNEIKQELANAQTNADYKQSKANEGSNIEEIFDKMRLFCKNQLNFSFRDVDRNIESLIIRPDQEISPLLKFYNELAGSSNFRLPIKALLEFDTRLFRQQIAKIKKSHLTQMILVKQIAKDKANAYLMSLFEKARKLLIDEVLHCMRQNEGMKTQYDIYEKQINDYQIKIAKQEVTIKEMKSYINWMNQYWAKIDKELCILNSGPSSQGGDLVDSLEQFNQMLSEKTNSLKKTRLFNLTNDFFEKKTFSLYSSSLQLNRQNKETIVQAEAVKYFQELNLELNDKLMIKESESMMVEFQQKEIRDNNKKLKQENEKLKLEIKDLKAEYAMEKKIAENKHRNQVEDLEHEIKVLRGQIEELKKVYSLESRVKDEVVAKLNEEKDSNKKMMRELATVLKIPRLHLEWMKKHGVDEFVDRCKKIIEMHDQEIIDWEHSLDRMKARHFESIDKFNNSAIDFQGGFKKARKEYSVEPIQAPFVLKYPVGVGEVQKKTAVKQRICEKEPKENKSLEFSQMANSTQMSIFEKEFSQASKGQVFAHKKLPQIKLNQTVRSPTQFKQNVSVISHVDEAVNDLDSCNPSVRTQSNLSMKKYSIENVPSVKQTFDFQPIKPTTQKLDLPARPIRYMSPVPQQRDVTSLPRFPSNIKQRNFPINLTAKINKNLNTNTTEGGSTNIMLSGTKAQSGSGLMPFIDTHTNPQEDEQEGEDIIQDAIINADLDIDIN